MNQQHLPLEQPTPPAHSLTEPRRLQTASSPQEEPTVSAAQADSVEILGAKLTHLVRKAQQHARGVGWLWMGYWGVILLGILFHDKVFGAKNTVNPFDLLSRLPKATLPCGIAFAGWLIYSRIRQNRQCRQVAKMLAEQDDICAVGPLTAALARHGLNDEATHAIAQNALTHLLPRLRPENADLLDKTQRALLLARLSYPLEVPAMDVPDPAQVAYQQRISFRLAMLQAFGQIGDSSMLPQVTKLAQGEANTEAERRIREAAQECLPRLEQRIEQQRNPQTLLRASSASDSGAETLLRAAQGSPKIPVDQLLRPNPPDL